MLRHYLDYFSRHETEPDLFKKRSVICRLIWFVKLIDTRKSMVLAVNIVPYLSFSLVNEDDFSKRVHRSNFLPNSLKIVCWSYKCLTQARIHIQPGSLISCAINKNLHQLGQLPTYNQSTINMYLMPYNQYKLCSVRLIW